MKKLLFPMALAVLSIPGAAAQSIFEGTWKADFSKISISTPKPWEYLVQDGMSTCKTCVPPVTVKADGKSQRPSGARVVVARFPRVSPGAILERPYGTRCSVPSG